MALMTIDLARIMNAEARAKILLNVDAHLRKTINNEYIFESWLMCGVPDGTKDWRELADIDVEEFVEMWNLAERLLNRDAAGDDAEEDEDWGRGITLPNKVIC